MRIAVLGAGFLGTRLAAELPRAALVRADITDRRALWEALRESGAGAVVNAAGKVGRPNVDACEDAPLSTAHANVTGALAVAEVCADLGAYLLHLGSGCVFYGPPPRPEGFAEDDPANPGSLYSRTKYAADLVLSRLPRVGIARLRTPVDHVPGPRNLITKLASYPLVMDVESSLTIVEDLVAVVAALVRAGGEGIFHVTNPGPVRHRDLLALYRAHVDASHACTFVPEEELIARGLTKARRSSCILASRRLAALGISMRHTADALPEVLARYGRAMGR